MEPPEHTLRSETSATLRLAAPVVGAQLGQTSMGFIDTVMVGRLGSEALAGVALGSTLYFFFVILCMGVVMAVGPMVSQAYGADEWSPVGRSVRQGFWLAFALTVPTFLALWFVAPVLLWMGQEPGTVARASAYLHAILWGFLPLQWFVALRNFVEGVGRPLPVTIITFGGVGLNVVANYTLMFGHWGFPAMGIVGTGWASTIVYWFMFIALAMLVRMQRPFRDYKVFSRIGRPDFHYFGKLFKIGWPIGISLGIESGAFTTTALLMGLVSTTALAAHTLAIHCAAFTFMVPLGIGIATSVRVGHAAGRHDAAGVRWAGIVGIVLAAGVMLCAAILFWTVPEAIIGLYLDVNDPANARVVRLAVTLLGIAAVFQLFDGIQVCAAGALRGLKDTRVPMLIGFIAYWVIGLSVGVALGFGAEWGARGLWWGLVVGLFTAAILLSWRFLRLTGRVVTEDVRPSEVAAEV